MHDYELQDRFIHIDARHVEEISPETNEELWETIDRATSELGVYRVLVHSGARGRSMPFMDIYKTGESPIEDHLRSLTIAFFMPHYEPDELTELFISLAAEGGHRVRFFCDEPQAVEWLVAG